MKNFFGSLWASYGRHLDLVRLPFEAVFDDPQLLDELRSRKHRNHFLCPIIISAVIFIDTVINEHYPEDEIRYRAPFHHIQNTFMPKVFRKMSTFIFLCLYLMTFSCGLFSYFNFYPHSDFILLYHDGELTYPYRKEKYRKVKDDLAVKLIAFYKRYRKLMKKVLAFLTIELDMAFFYPLLVTEAYLSYSTNGETLPTPRVIIMATACPFYWRYLVFAINIGIRFMIQNVIIQIQQLHYLSRMDLRPFANLRSLRRGYHRWYRTMDQILDVTRCIEHMSRFYTIYVTFQICMFGLLGCRIWNVSASKWDEAPFLQVSPWMVFGSVYLLNLWLFNVFSSRTIYLNVRLFKALRQFQIRLLSVRGLSLNQVVKLDLVNEYKLFLQKCSFKLITSGAINNKLFAFQIFGCVSVFWMKMSAEKSIF